jgi:hypothetical protein
MIGPVVPPSHSNTVKDNAQAHLDSVKANAERQETDYLTKPILSNEDFKWAVEKNIISSIESDDVAQMQKDWMAKFVQINGLSVLIETLRATNEKNQALSPTEVLKSKDENNFLCLLLQTINCLVMAAFSANMPGNELVRELSRKLSTAVQDDEKPEEGEAAEKATMQTANPELMELGAPDADAPRRLEDIIQEEEAKEQLEAQGASTAQKSKAQETREDMFKMISPLRQLLEGELACDVLEQIDYKLFQNEVLRTALVLLRREAKYMTAP